MQNIIEIIKSIDSQSDTFASNINPTLIYNEGWMTRLLVHQSIIEGLILEGIDFSEIANWTSEALISSPFIKAKENREGYTHADIAIGDFHVDYKSRGEIRIHEGAKIFGIIEAKMGSGLSKRTVNASVYNQASRNLVCIANNTFNKLDCKTFFYIVVPESKISKIEIYIDKQVIENQARNRFNLHSDENVIGNRDLILSKINNCDIKVISYENWIESIKDSDAKNRLQEFYEKAKSWNKIK